MPTSLTIRIDTTDAEATLTRLRGAMTARQDINKVMSYDVADLVRRHFTALEMERSHRSHYYADAADSTMAEFDDDRAVVVTYQPGIAYHRWGGTINAAPGKALAIPMTDDSYGQRASEYFQGAAPGSVFILRSKSGKAFLAQRDGKNGFKLLYLLLKSVTKGPQDDTLPTDDQLSQTASEAVQTLITETLRVHKP